jgi:hypothetical protein
VVLKGGGLYYMDDVSTGHVFHVRSDGRERQIQLWHQRLGHPNFGFLKHVLPELFSNMVHSELKCPTYIVAKSHRTSYLPSLIKAVFRLHLFTLMCGDPPLFLLSWEFDGSSSLLMTVPA